MACGCFQVLQAMSNGSAMRSGVQTIWVGAISASISTLILVVVAAVIDRLPFPDTGLVLAQGMKIVAGGTFGAFIVVGLAFVAPRLGPMQTFLVLLFRCRSHLDAHRWVRSSRNGSPAVASAAAGRGVACRGLLGARALLRVGAGHSAPAPRKGPPID